MSNRIYPALIIGAGASGLFAASILGKKALVLDGNNMPGRKLLLTGGGRCNYTHDSAIEELLAHYRAPSNSMKRILYSLPPSSIISYFRMLGIDEEVTEEGKVFPLNGNSRAIVDALARDVSFSFGEKALEITKESNLFRVITDKNEYLSENVLIATGCNAYKETGSDGMGLELLKAFGHRTIPFTPALAPIELERKLIGAENITLDIEIRCNKETIRGSALITKRGLTGPAAENISYMLDEMRDIEISFIDITKEELKARNGKLLLKNAIELPPRLTESLLKAIANKRIADLNKSDLELIESNLMHYRTRAKAIKEGAMAAYGGALLEDFNLKTMESKLVPGLYAAGDILSPSADCGGYSLTFAFATAFIAANALKRKP